MAQVCQLTSPVEGISCHAWNGRGDQLAICPNSNELHLYTGTNNPDSSTWVVSAKLKEHDLVISAVDWSPVTNKIVTCSHDRNAFVWTEETKTVGGKSVGTGVWKPSLTLLRIDRAALDVKWSPDGKKFAVASGAKCVPICHYEADQDWWVSKMIKKHKSTVLCVAWHPNSQILATGACDFKCRVFSAYVDAEGVDKASGPQPGPFATAQGFGEVYTELSCNGWVHGVAFSPSGNTLAYTGHNSTIHIVTLGREPLTSAVVPLRDLPATCLSFVSERAIIAGGHDFNPFILTATASGQWSFMQYLDQKSTASSAKSSASGNVAAARAIFQQKTSRGQEGKKEEDELWTKHEAPVMSLVPHPSGRNPKGITSFSTSGMDGRVIVWNLPSLNIALASLGLQ